MFYLRVQNRRSATAAAVMAAAAEVNGGGRRGQRAAYAAPDQGTRPPCMSPPAQTPSLGLELHTPTRLAGKLTVAGSPGFRLFPLNYSTVITHSRQKRRELRTTARLLGRGKRGSTLTCGMSGCMRRRSRSSPLQRASGHPFRRTSCRAPAAASRRPPVQTAPPPRRPPRSPPNGRCPTARGARGTRARTRRAARAQRRRAACGSGPACNGAGRARGVRGATVVRRGMVRRLSPAGLVLGEVLAGAAVHWELIPRPERRPQVLRHKQWHRRFET